MIITTAVADLGGRLVEGPRHGPGRRRSRAAFSVPGVAALVEALVAGGGASAYQAVAAVVNLCPYSSTLASATTASVLSTASSPIAATHVCVLNLKNLSLICSLLFFLPFQRR